ncbi:hypothetical protein K435DRAFT_854947 [Dendrothele bispora CBS 962.96]|uniref:BTB domain-containing protein n=1 Tax=Dendrothele bispora (strain CBS 962.96) TaxID=1314807 RepID=A0A4S8MDU9_DENBC|nr:hypothetical protein K435DRAFT_854947 [Dendrothele bispora CBS 962.96]
MSSTTTPPAGVTVTVNVPNPVVEGQPSRRAGTRATSTSRRPAQDRTVSFAELKHSTKFPPDDENADWIVLSDDGVLFGLHAANAEICSDKIYDLSSPDVSNDNLEWHIRINAPENVLELLFEYLYNKRRMNLESISIDLLVKLVYAAEEYGVRSAIDACQKALRKHIHENALKVLQVSSKFDYRDEIIKAAVYLVDEDLPVVGANLSKHLHMPFSIYREQFTSAHLYALEACPEHPDCLFWPGLVLATLKTLRGKPRRVLNKTEKIFHEAVEKTMLAQGPNACCIGYLRYWGQCIMAQRSKIGLLEIPTGEKQE